MSQKDWMKVRFTLTSRIRELSESVYFGLFIHDTTIILPFKTRMSLLAHLTKNVFTMKNVTVRGKRELE